MSTNRNINRSQSQASDASLGVGLAKHEPTLASFMIAGKTVKTADVLTALQSRQNSAKAVDAARATWQAAVATERNVREQSNAMVSGVKQSLHVMFAGSPDILADFGLTPRKQTAVSPGVRVAAAAKAKATRAARHTQGSKQKAAIKGALDGVKLIVTAQPPASSASSLATATPTPTAPAAVTGVATPAASSK
jgi:hypothetical protein